MYKIIELSDKVLILRDGQVWGYAETMEEAHRIIDEEGLLEDGVVIVKM